MARKVWCVSAIGGSWLLVYLDQHSVYVLLGTAESFVLVGHNVRSTMRFPTYVRLYILLDDIMLVYQIETTVLVNRYMNARTRRAKRCLWSTQEDTMS